MWQEHQKPALPPAPREEAAACQGIFDTLNTVSDSLTQGEKMNEIK